MTQKLLKQLLNYDKETGVFRWKVKSKSRKVGDIAGSKNPNGYIYIGINKKIYAAHHLAWLYVYGEFPKETDHINHIRNDNKINNLRSVTRTENCKNHLIQKNNKSGIQGVYWDKSHKKWRAIIDFDSKHKHLGYFDDINKAKEVRQEAKIKYGYHSNHGI